MNPSTTSGYILAGGRSSRLGQDKRLIRIEETIILDRTCQLVRNVLGSEPVLVGDDIPIPIAGGCRVINDVCADSGPLAGLVAALDDCRSEWALILAVDLPFLQIDQLLKLIQTTCNDCQVVTLAKSERLEPLVAKYRCDTLSFWQDRLLAGRLSLLDGFQELAVESIAIPNANRDLFNLNTPADLTEFNRVLQK
jgi:molybdenum cofactor guanylyltransferase